MYSGVERASARLTAAAVRDGKVTVAGKQYTLTFIPTVPGYRVTDGAGEHVVTLVGKHISRAKRDLREYLED